MMDKRIELMDDETELVNGGNWITDAWDATCDFCSEYKAVIITGASLVAGAALCATGAGALVGAGLIGGTIAEGAVVGGIIGGSAAGMTAATLTTR